MPAEFLINSYTVTGEPMLNSDAGHKVNSLVF